MSQPRPFSFSLLYLLLLQLSAFALTNATDAFYEVTSESPDRSPHHLDQRKHYCMRNVTYYEEVAVNKTRTVEIKPTGVFKMFKKTKYQQETYVATERVPRTRLVNDCCEGYAKTENENCQPVCPSGCPANGFCRAPNMCQCKRGYHAVKSTTLDSYSCEPRCSSGCPYGGWCITPEVCACKTGYRAAAGTCVPTCATGNLTDCEEGEATGSTEATTYDSTVYDDEVDTNGTAVGDVGDSNEDSAEDDVDESTLLFPSNELEANCTLQPCIGTTKCRLVGSCACAEGFIRHQPAPVNGTEVGPICAAVIEQGEPLREYGTSNGWVGAFFIIVGVAVMVGALMFLSVKLWRHRRGSMDVEGKNSMCCKYDKNSSSSDSDTVQTI